MTDPYITNLHQPGEILTRADRNIVDADTANLVQGPGSWGENFNAEGFAVLADPTSPFADTTLEWMNTLADTWTTAETGWVPIDPSVPIVASTWVKSPVDTDGLYGIETDDGFINSGVIPMVADQWYLFTLSMTPGPAATEARVSVAANWNEVPLPALTRFQLAAHQIAYGTDPDFWPSIRITGDIDLRADVQYDWLDDSFQEVINSRPSPNIGYSLQTGIDTPDPYIGSRYGDGVSDRSRFVQDPQLVDQRHQIRALFVRATGTWQYFVDATQVGGDQSGESTDPGAPSEALLAIGGNTTGGVARGGKYFSVELYDGDGDAGAPLVYRMNAADVLAGVGP